MQEKLLIMVLDTSSSFVHSSSCGPALPYKAHSSGVNAADVPSDYSAI